MDVMPHGWKVFDPHTPVLTYRYSFGPGTANALAVGGQGGLVIVSPPCRIATGVFDDLSQYGSVRALVASNAFHYLGVPEWKRRFPDAAVFAPAQSISRVERQTKLQGVRPVAEAMAVTGPHLELVDMPHYKTGEVLVRIKPERGLVWYVTDVIMNLSELPTHPLIKGLFRLSRSALGSSSTTLPPYSWSRTRRR